MQGEFGFQTVAAACERFHKQTLNNRQSVSNRAVETALCELGLRVNSSLLSWLALLFSLGTWMHPISTGSNGGMPETGTVFYCLEDAFAKI